MKISLKNDTITCVDENFTHKTHLPLSTSFKEIEVLKDGRILVCEDYYKFEYHGKSNIYCLNRTLDIDWFLERPNPALEPDDVYVGFNTKGEKVCANSWTCFWVEIDLENGTIKDIAFTK